MKYITTLTILLLFIASCTKEDTENPTISMLSPAMGQSFTSGDIIQAAANITDDTELSAYTFKVVNGSGNLTTDFNWISNGSLNGTSDVFASSYEVTDEPSGNYQIQFMVQDAAGNTNTVARNISIN